jgi:hypothetical protein
MRFETAIEHLVDNYRYAKSKVWIRDEVAWALYHTWKEADDRKTENCSEKPNNCEDAENPSGDVWECGCFLDTYCEHQIYDRNPDGTINIVECRFEPNDEPQTNGYQTFNGTSVYVSRLEDDIQTNNGIGCSRCEGRFDCYDRDMPHAVHCNNYGKITDEQTERSE